MLNIILVTSLIVGFIACIVEIYFITAYIRSRFGKYPPFVFSFGKAKHIVIKEAENFLQKQKSPINIFDLGCGDGCLLIPLAKKFPQHNFIGYDWDKVPYYIAKFRTKKIANIQIRNCDFMKQDYQNAQLILCYTGNGLSEPLGYKLNSEIPKNCLVISEAFELKHLSLMQTISSPTLKMPIKVFLYQKKS